VALLFNMLWGLGIASLRLSERGAEAPFALAQRVVSPGQETGDSWMSSEEEQDEDEAEEPEVRHVTCASYMY
jgi:hypothetical protein